jgi:general stress protein 26
MTDTSAIEHKFWKALKSDMTLMLGLDGVEQSLTQPMTAQFEDEGEHGPIWFFTSKDNGLVKAMASGHRAVAHFVSKGHDVFASISGDLTLDNDPATIDKLWNKFVAAWYPGGKSDPNLQLIRLDADMAEIWLNENNVFAMIKSFFGADPKATYKDKTAKVALAS